MILKKILRKSLTAISPFKGQKGQDRWVIFSIMGFKKKGYFLDLAAADGITHSNTYALEKLFSWNGLCIEPNPNFFKQLKGRRKCHMESTVISDKIEEVIFRIDNGQLGGIVAQDTDNSLERRSDELKKAETMTFTTTTLVEILDKYKAPKVIDYFSLDIEGSEERIISSFDFSKYRFNCITIERPTPKVNAVLFENDYVFVKNYKCDSFYVHSSIKKEKNIKCDPFEQVPPKAW